MFPSNTGCILYFTVQTAYSPQTSQMYLKCLEVRVTGRWSASTPHHVWARTGWRTTALQALFAVFCLTGCSWDSLPQWYREQPQFNLDVYAVESHVSAAVDSAVIDNQDPTIPPPAGPNESAVHELKRHQVHPVYVYVLSGVSEVFRCMVYVGLKRSSISAYRLFIFLTTDRSIIIVNILKYTTV